MHKQQQQQQQQQPVAVTAMAVVADDCWSSGLEVAIYERQREPSDLTYCYSPTALQALPSSRVGVQADLQS